MKLNNHNIFQTLRGSSPILNSSWQRFEEENRVAIYVKFSLCIINLSLCHEDIWGSGGIASPFLTSARDGAE
jgi:hypothetical protein